MKQEKTWDGTMAEMNDTASCARVGEMVSFLYNEATDVEAGDFRMHLESCAACREELSAFGEVRAGILTWRDDAMAPMPMMATDAATLRATIRRVTDRSALAALREFFTLSPLWLRGATGFAGVLFAALLVVTVMHFFERTENAVVKQTPPVDAVPIEKVASKTLVQVKQTDAPLKANTPNRTKVRDSRIARDTRSNRREKSPVLSEEERSQLSDLLIAAREDEENVPRLYDLLSESN